MLINLGVVKYLDKKYLGSDLGGGGAALDQSTMVLNPDQLVLIFFIGITIFTILQVMWYSSKYMQLCIFRIYQILICYLPQC